MERKIGEIFEYNGEWYQCIPDTTDDNCNNCYFQKNCSNITGDCSSTNRSDGKTVAFKKLEKVGEPYYSKYYGKFYQKYITYIPVVGYNFKVRIEPVEHVSSTEIYVELKQNKEDMEEKGQCGDNRFEIIDKAKEALLNETNIARDEQEMAVIDNILFRCWQMGWLDKYDDTKHSNSEKIGKNLREFDLKAAKEGKPVCTRDGRKARIICFDKQEGFPIIALVETKVNDRISEEIALFNINGRAVSDDIDSKLDLMMLPEKKEGWVNLYDDIPIYDTKEEALNRRSKIRGLIDTIKVSWEE